MTKSLQQEQVMTEYMNVGDGFVRTTSTGEDDVFYQNVEDRKVERPTRTKLNADKLKMKSKFRFDQFDDDDNKNYYVLSHDSNNSPSISSRESNATSPTSDIDSCACPSYVNTPTSVSPQHGYMNVPSNLKSQKSLDELCNFSLNYTNIYHKSDHSESSSLRSSSTTSLARYGCEVSYTNIDITATDAIRRAGRDTTEKEEEGTKKVKKSSKGKKMKRLMCLPVSLKLSF